MKMLKRIVSMIMIAAAGCLLMSCSGSGNTAVAYAEAALERSGVRDVFFEPFTFYADQGVTPPKNHYPYSLHIREDKYYDQFKSLTNPDLKVQSPLYYLEWEQSGHCFLSAKAKDGSFKDDDALTTGTLVFMEVGTYRSQTYEDKKGNHYYGTQESVRVYLYDLSSGNFIAEKKFTGADLKNHEQYSGSGNSFENKVSRKEIDDWIDSLR